MGRIGSIYGFFEALFIIILTAIFGIFAEWITIRSVVVSASFMMLVVAVILLLLNVQPTKGHYYQRIVNSRQQ